MKRIFLLLLSPLALFAKCLYSLDVNISNNTLQATANIQSQEVMPKVNTDGLNILSYSGEKNKLRIVYEKSLTLPKDGFISLLANWYPTLKEACSYNTNITLPKGYVAVSEADEMLQEKEHFSFRLHKPTPYITLQASKEYKVTITQYKDITLSTYFFTANKSLASQYLEKTKTFIKEYETLIGPFPYKRFSVVENRYQTGYSFATYTLIGSALLPRPYLLERSLGHEIMHQYFGSAIYNDAKKGNWVEGLTTALTDNRVLAKNKEAKHARKSLLNSFEGYVKEGKDFSINEFTHRFDRMSMHIGYNKLAFVFYMLEQQLEPQEFQRLLKTFYKTYAFQEVNLRDLEGFFIRNASKDLREFFQDWFYQTGMINFEAHIKESLFDGTQFVTTVTLEQKSPNPYTFKLPVTLYTTEGVQKESVLIDAQTKTFSLRSKAFVKRVLLDEQIELFRTLSPKEKLHNIAKLYEKNTLIISDGKVDKSLEKLFKQARFINSKELRFEELKNNNVIFIGQNNSLLKSIAPNVHVASNGLSIKVFENLFNAQHAMAVLHSQTDFSRLVRTLKHYGKYSALYFKDQQLLTKEKALSQDGITLLVAQEPKLHQNSPATNLQAYVNSLTNERVVYVGESHTNMAHHLNQLAVIKALYTQNKNLAIGMEMFQQPFQDYLDAYINKRLNERELLEKSEYFKRWKLNYNYYRPILNFAREHGIRVIALNISRDITKKVSKEGLFALKKKDKTLLPKTMDFSNHAYKKSLEAIFVQHKGDINTEFFYQSQLVWDEVMAKRIADYLHKNPKERMVVLAGSGHIKAGNGIPSRVKRRLDIAQSILLNDESEGADFSFFNSYVPKVAESKKLGVYLVSDTKLIVTQNVKDSFAERVGFLKDDKILSLNGKEVSSLEALKLELFFIKNYEDIQVEILRKGKRLILREQSH